MGTKNLSIGTGMQHQSLYWPVKDKQTSDTFNCKQQPCHQGPQKDRSVCLGAGVEEGGMKYTHMFTISSPAPGESCSHLQ